MLGMGVSLAQKQTKLEYIPLEGAGGNVREEYLIKQRTGDFIDWRLTWDRNKKVILIILLWGMRGSIEGAEVRSSKIQKQK